MPQKRTSIHNLFDWINVSKVVRKRKTSFSNNDGENAQKSSICHIKCCEPSTNNTKPFLKQPREDFAKLLTRSDIRAFGFFGRAKSLQYSYKPANTSTLLPIHCLLKRIEFLKHFIKSHQREAGRLIEDN